MGRGEVSANFSEGASSPRCRNPNEVNEECKPSEINILPAAMMQLFTIEHGWRAKRGRISRRIGAPRFFPGSFPSSAVSIVALDAMEQLGRDVYDCAAPSNAT